MTTPAKDKEIVDTSRRGSYRNRSTWWRTRSSTLAAAVWVLAAEKGFLMPGTPLTLVETTQYIRRDAGDGAGSCNPLTYALTTLHGL